MNFIEDVISRSKRRVSLLIPYSKQSILSAIYNEYSVSLVDYRDDGIFVDVTMDARGTGLYAAYRIEE